MNVLILAGGLGLRLRPIISDLPKPMALFQGKPFLEYQIRQLQIQGITRVVLCTGYLGGQIETYFGNGKAWGLDIHYAFEERLLGTGGAIRNAQEYIDGPFVLLNGDSFLELNVQRLIDFHMERRQSDQRTMATLASVLIQNVADYGSLHVGPDGIIQRFIEKGGIGPGWVNGGVYVFESDILDFIPANQTVSLEKTLFPMLINTDKLLYSYPCQGFFVDIGTPAGYQRFDQYLKSGMSIGADL